MRQVKIRPFAIANWVHEGRCEPSGAGWHHTLDRCKEAFAPFGMIGHLDANGRLESPDGIWSARDVPAHCYRAV